jgi:hypothetical protein
MTPHAERAGAKLSDNRMKLSDGRGFRAGRIARPTCEVIGWDRNSDQYLHHLDKRQSSTEWSELQPEP